MLINVGLNEKEGSRQPLFWTRLTAHAGQIGRRPRNILLEVIPALRPERLFRHSGAIEGFRRPLLSLFPAAYLPHQTLPGSPTVCPLKAFSTCALVPRKARELPQQAKVGSPNSSLGLIPAVAASLERAVSTIEQKGAPTSEEPGIGCPGL